MDSAAARDELVRVLRLDLVGPEPVLVDDAEFARSLRVHFEALAEVGVLKLPPT